MPHPSHTPHARVRGDSRRAWRVVASIMAAVLSLPAAALAVASTRSPARADVTARPGLVVAYDYTGATATTWDEDADWSSGSFAATTTDTGDLTLVPHGPAGTRLPDPTIPWWDLDWRLRTCVDITHVAPGAAALDEYQIEVPFDLPGLAAAGHAQADGGDLRAVGPDGVTLLPAWFDASRGTVWVRVDAIAVGSGQTVCVYHDHPSGVIAAPAINRPEAVFSYTSPKPIYYAVSGRFDSNPTPVAVVSLVDGNSVSRDGGPSLPLSTAGDRTVFSAAGTSSGSVFSVLGPINGRALGNGFDTLVPISFAGTRFAAPTTRSTQRLSFFAPFADATVSIANGSGAPYATVVVPQGTSVTINSGDITGSNSAVITSDVPVLATHVTTNGRDAVALYPATTEPLLGIRTTSMRIGYIADATTVTAFESGGGTRTYTGDRGDSTVVGGGGRNGGDPDDARRLVADMPIGAFSQADGDGAESTTFLPEGEIGSDYWIPANTQYIAVACPDPPAGGVGLVVTRPDGTTRTFTCTGPGAAGFPGWGRDTANIGVTAGRGIRVHAPGGEPFFVFYEYRDRNDETNVLGLKQARQLAFPAPVVAAPWREGLVASTTGTWESPTVTATSADAIYGMIDAAATLPAGTAVDFQIATHTVDPPTAFVGPDGTAASWYAPADLIALRHDGDPFLRVRARLSTTDPTVSPRLHRLTVTGDLPRLARSADSPGVIGVAAPVGAAIVRPLIRLVNPDPAFVAAAHLRWEGGSGLTMLNPATFRFRETGSGLASDQLTILDGPPTPPTGPPIGFGATAGHSLVLDGNVTSAGTAVLSVTWRAETTPTTWVEVPLRIEVTAS